MVMMMMSVPVIMAMAVALVRGIVALLVAAARHKHLKVLGAVRMVMVLTESPVVEQWVARQQPGLGAIRIFYRGRPGVVMEMVEELGVDPA